MRTDERGVASPSLKCGNILLSISYAIERYAITKVLARSICMKSSVIITSYNRSWALPHCLGSLATQSLLPDEVIVVLKPSGDGSEEIIDEHGDNLPIRTIIQKEGNVAVAAAMGIEAANGDLLIFIDDDAVAHREFIERYSRLFSQLQNPGGLTGVVFSQPYGGEGDMELQIGSIQPRRSPKRTLSFRRPLSAYRKYDEWITVSGHHSRHTIDLDGPMGSILSPLLMGCNMALLKTAVDDCPLAQLYGRSKSCLRYESLLALWARLKGYETYICLDVHRAPIVWHLVHDSSTLSRGKGFKGEFWRYTDDSSFYFKLKKLGLDVSFFDYSLFSLTDVVGTLLSEPRKFLPRSLAAGYTFLTRLIGHY
ncbi:MAG: glycosyltransferase family 2 protein [Methanomassiliicoccales archaeon]|nr:glycosyltransferase family 2 protein [Methanomassiliicoccales archaeon]